VAAVIVGPSVSPVLHNLTYLPPFLLYLLLWAIHTRRLAKRGVPHYKLLLQEKTLVVHHGAFGRGFVRRNRNESMIDYKVYRMVEGYDSRNAGKTIWKRGRQAHLLDFIWVMSVSSCWNTNNDLVYERLVFLIHFCTFTHSLLSTCFFSHRKRHFVPRELLPKSRDKIVLFRNGFVCAPIILSSTMPSVVTGVVPSWDCNLVKHYKL
jgi:hypothetical protein